MRIKSYPPEKRDLLVKSPVEMVRVFLQEVPGPVIKPLLLTLPKEDGFRTGTPNELQKRLHTFLGKRRRWTDTDWKLFGDMWQKWVKSVPGLDGALAEYDNNADFADGEEGTPPNSELDLGCFDHLIRVSQQGTVSKEQISKFYTFGYFLPDTRIDQTIMMAKPEAEISLPTELTELKQRVEELGELLRRADKRIEAVNRDGEQLSAVARRLSLVEKSVKEGAKVTQQNHQVGDKRISDLKEDLKKLQADAKATEKANAKAHAKPDYKVEMKQELDRIEQQLLSELLQRTDAVSRRADEAIKVIASQVDRLSQETASLSAELQERLAVQPVDEPLVQPVVPPSSQPSVTTLELRAAMKTERLPAMTATNVLRGQSDAVKALSDNFRAIGMQTADAQAFSTEIMASLLAGQIVMFRGSTASLVPTVTARTLAAEDTYRISLPVGLLDGRDLRVSLEELIREADQRDRVIVLILEGINLSAPEVYATRLRSLVTDRLFGLDTDGRGLLILATVADGCGALPVTPELFDVGPVFHTDCLTWRDKWPKRTMLPGLVPLSLWSDWTAPPTEANLHWDDLFVECRKLTQQIPVALRRCLNTVSERLDLLTAELKDQPTILQSLAFGWLLPRAIAEGVDLETKNKILAGGRLDSAEPDRRIANLISDQPGGGSD